MRSVGTIRSFVTIAAATAFLAACGSSNNPTSANGGTTAGTTGFTRGAITAFGTNTVTVGNDDFTTSASTQRKRLDDGPNHIPGADDAVFRPGMVVEVFHRQEDKNAVEIRFQDDLEGPITAKPGTGGATFDVLGVPVIVDTNTHFDDSLGQSGLSLNTLAVGDFVELSGLFDANGALRATFIEGKRASSQAAGREAEIKGSVANLSGTAPNQTFTVNGVRFQMNATTQTSDIPTSGLANGMFVEVKTSPSAPFTQPFLATKVEGTFEDPEAEVRGADKASVEGFVTSLSGTSPNLTFKLGNTTVTTSSATTGVALVTAGAHIEAEGGVVNGTINALTIGARP